MEWCPATRFGVLGGLGVPGKVVGAFRPRFRNYFLVARRVRDTLNG